MLFVLVFFAGTIAGFSNVIVDEGSMITLPTLTNFLSLPSLFGAILGSFVAMQIEKDLLEKLVGILFLTMVVFLVWKPKL
ncbi:MAG TPA: hypothetical protein EYH25_01575 [Thermotoga sp.]|nr:hypothetical protein [Thermotoga sp.]